MSKELKLSAPWLTLFHEYKALFGKDPAIKLDYNEDEQVIKMFVEGQEKADALEKLLPTKYVFGNVVVSIEIIPANVLESNATDLFQKAFKGNPVFSKTVSKRLDAHTFGADYVVFKNEVVQYWNDQLDDVYGNVSTLYQDIARDIFVGISGVFFCTDIPQ